MKTPISYYGGKQNLVPDILQLIPPHVQYVEPFFGGGAVFFAKKPSQHEVINDLDDRVINFYRVLKTQFYELQSLIQSTLHSESLHKQAKELLNTGTDLERAWAFWVQTNMSFGKQIGCGFAFCNTQRNARQTKNKRDNFTDHYKKRVEQIEIFNRDALELIKLKDGVFTFFYIDPPYVSADQGHYKGYTKDNFINLLNALENLKGKFLLSCYPETELMEYRKRLNWNYQDKTGNISVSLAKHGRKQKTECLTFNYEPTNKQRCLFDEIPKN